MYGFGDEIGTIGPGFGTPIGAPEAAFAGFGDPVDTIEYGLVDGEVLDDGGYQFNLNGEWPAGPYRVFLEDANGVQHPSTGPCNAWAPGTGPDIDAVAGETILEVASPPLPLGNYVVTVRWGIGFSESLEMSRPLVVLRRRRVLATYGWRRVYPGPRPVGARSLGAERVLSESPVWES